MALTISTASASFRAPACSEDRLAVHPIDGGHVVVVADGAGGISGGRRAAELAVQTITDAVHSAGRRAFDTHRLRELLLYTDEVLESDREAGESTLVVVAITDAGALLGASVGDSGALVIRSDARADELTAAQHRKHRLGCGQALPVTFERPTLDGALVLATDGLFAFAPRERIALAIHEHRHELDGAAQALVAAARLPGGGLQDDLAVVLVQCRPR
jgi:serine/threonine protein phosphatase PrpC